MARFAITRNKFKTDESFATKAGAIKRAQSLATNYPEYRWEVRDTNSGKVTIIYPAK